MLKYWFKIQPKSGGSETLLTIAPVSQRCPVKLDTANIKAINTLVQRLEVGGACVCGWVCGCMCMV